MPDEDWVYTLEPITGGVHVGPGPCPVAEAAEARSDEWSKLAVSLQVRVSELEAALREIHANYCMADNIERIAREALASKGKGND